MKITFIRESITLVVFQADCQFGRDLKYKFQ